MGSKKIEFELDSDVKHKLSDFTPIKLIYCISWLIIILIFFQELDHDQ
jgi:hypothetical protein